MKKNRKQEKRRSCQLHSAFLGFNISFSCTQPGLLICCQRMPARCHFYSGFPTRGRRTEGQLTNGGLSVTGLNINLGLPYDTLND